MNNGYNYKKWGVGSRPLIFLHDFGSSGLSWEWVARQMPADFTCYAPDIPGFGSSSAVDDPNLTSLARESLSLIEQIKGANDNPSIVAHGFSVALVLKMLTQARPAWDQLVFVNPSLPVGGNFHEPGSVHMAEHPNRQIAMETVSRGVTMPLRADRFSLAIEAQLMADSRTWRWWLEKGCKETIDPVPAIQNTLTILSSIRDPRVDLIATRREIAIRFPAAVVREHPTAGHMLPLEDDAWVASQIRQALATKSHSKNFVF